MVNELFWMDICLFIHSFIGLLKRDTFAAANAKQMIGIAGYKPLLSA